MMTPMPEAKPKTRAVGGRKAAISIPSEDHIRSVGTYPCSLAYTTIAVVSMPRMLIGQSADREVSKQVLQDMLLLS